MLEVIYFGGLRISELVSLTWSQVIRRDNTEAQLEVVGKGDLSAIANRYLNEPTGGTFEFEFKSDVAAYRAMKCMFVDRAQHESKARIIKRMTG